ncbi:hypothetical protein amb1010 [Paramagnetospirillum magneticum AMB-1]|uniref:Uncharacterized protein n=1 Tax=Paramagnetospirillum magneticum (strain ATCC 700264 / AMB-1) TaxID=342108 RepID=Q2W8L1_PARM1|nr:hypothetical protein amb1010 [Paramagnetospirillum magneticum AMB-1]
MGDHLSAAILHLPQFVAQKGEVGNFAFHLVKMEENHLIGTFARGIGSFGQSQQGTDGIDGKAQIAAPANEAEPLKMVVLILTKAALAPCRRRQ